ncbi:MAG: hypothetical protein HYU78_04380 [Rhodocyclales bacterium]|nr:hypothetical protein [Rhodocyclales bacterium]
MFDKLVEMAVSGVVGNAAYDQLKAFFARSASVPPAEPPVPEEDPDIKERYGNNIQYVSRYKVFSLDRDMNAVLSLMKKPVVHFVVEDKPTSAWHLPSIVIEDAITFEWYVFSKGNIAFEGSGGGLHHAESLIRFLIEKNIPFTAWVLDRISSDKLDQGCRTWIEVKSKCIPLLAHRSSEYFEKYVAGKYVELSRA